MSLVVRDLRRLYCWLTIHYCQVIASFWNHCPVHSCQFWSSNNKKNFVSVKLVWVQWLQTPVTVLWWPKHWCYRLRIFWINCVKMHNKTYLIILYISQCTCVETFNALELDIHVYVRTAGATGDNDRVLGLLCFQYAGFHTELEDGRGCTGISPYPRN